MTMTERFEDWLIRYSLLYKKRYTKNQKKRFLQSFVTDLLAVRDDIAIRKDKKDKDSHYIVVGDLKKAKHVLATYYDTPAIYTGDYHYFNTDKQRKQTLNLLILLSLIVLLLGAVFTFFVGIPLLDQPFSYRTVLLIGFYFVYFYFFGRLTRGWPAKENLIRNTSSLLYLLNFLAEHPEPAFAYVFFDNGCQGDMSIQKVKNKLNLKNQRLTLLDCVGAKGELIRVAKSEGQGIIPTVISKELDKNCEFLLVATQTGTFSDLAISKEALKEKELNQENYEKLNTFFK